MAFAKLMAWLRKAATRTINDLWNAIDAAMKRFTPSECRSYIRAAGYDFERSENALATDTVAVVHVIDDSGLVVGAEEQDLVEPCGR